MAKYVVTGAYVTCKTMGRDGPVIVGLYAGAPVPADAEQSWIDHHLRVNLIEAVPEPAPPARAAPAKTDARAEGDKPAQKPAAPGKQG
jgi:hypothetical protein